MKNIISKDELLKKIRSSKNHTTHDSLSNTIIIGTYKMPPCKPLHYIQNLQPLPKINVDPENYPDLKVDLVPGIYLFGANRIYYVSEVDRINNLVEAILLWYDSNKCNYSFTIGNIYEFKMEEFTSDFWMKYYSWRRLSREEFTKFVSYPTFIHPGIIIYDSSVNGYFKFIDHVSHLKLASGEEHWILKAFLLYTEDNSLKRQYRDCPKSYYTDNIYIKKYPYIINYKNVKSISNNEYLELITGIKNLEIEESKNPVMPMRFLLNCLLDSGSFETEGKTYYITRLDETEVKCIEITEDFSIIHHTFNLDNLPINHG